MALFLLFKQAMLIPLGYGSAEIIIFTLLVHRYNEWNLFSK